MRRIIRGLAAFAVLLVVFSIVSPAASAVKTMPAEVTRIAGGTWVNPLDGDLPDETEPSSAEPADGLSGDRSVISTEQAIVSMRQHLVNRDTSFSVTVSVPEGDLNDYAWYLIRHSMDHTGVPDEGDYIISQFRSLNWQFQQTDDELTVSLTVSYRSSRSQENQVDQKVAQILEELDLPRENDYETFLAVYGYLTEHVTYPSTNSGIAHTAYGALINNSAVCQGFASALYRLCLEAGIDCRYCSSTAQNHAWNIVGLNGEYYLTDATWDRKKDENAFYRYCLCGTEDWRTRHFTSNGTSTTFGDEFYGKNDPNGKPDAPWFDPVEQYPLSRVGFEEGRHLLTVDYVYPSGSQAAQSYSSMEWPCDTYSVPVPSIAGYTPSMSTVTGSMPGHDLSVTVEYVPAGHVHSWNSGTVTTAATCTDCGVKTYSCGCGATKTERIAPNGHTFSGNNCTVCGLQTVAKGTITGGSAKWTLESNGKLTVFGDGFMGVLSSLERVPWKANLADITSVEIREGITTVCTLAFDGCTNLTSVSLPEGLLSVCNKAFHGCTSLTELELPDSVRLIDKNAFLDAGLTSLSLGESAYYFGPDCFNGCNDLNEVSYAGTLEQWCYADIKNVLGNPGWCASSFAVSGEELAGEIRIPEPVRKVRPYTFVNRSLTSAEFPETLQAIGKMAFSGNTGLEELVFPGDCPEAGESIVNDAALDIHYPCANGTWNDSSMAELSNETHMPGCTVEEWCKDHLWDDGTWVNVDGHSVLRYTCLRCGETSDGPSSETISITLTKNWSDGNNQDGIRPSSVTVNVVGKNPSGTVVVPSFAVTITSANNWTKTVGDLDKYYQGNQLITYSIQSENAVSGYTASISGLTVTNTHTPATTSITLTKNWSDGNNQDGIRPSSVTVNVVGKVGNTTVVQPFAVTVTSANNWTKTVSGLAQKHAGQTITYSIQSENAVSGYTASISGLTVTNTHTPATTSITLTKTWADDENRLGLRPADVTVTVTGTAGGETVYTQDYTLTASGNWQLQVSGLYRYSGGREIAYAITSEEPVENYTAQIDGLTVTNTLEDIPPVSFDLEAELVIGGVGLEWPEAPEAPLYEVWRRKAGGEFEKIGETAERTYADLTVDVLTTYEYQIRILNGSSDIEEIATGRFLDVLPSDAYNRAVNWAVENAIVNGTGPTTFSPSAACTRAQFALMLYRMAGKPEVDMSVNPFTDLPNNSGIRKAIVWAYSEGIVNGTSPTTYSPDNNITRAQLVIMLYKMAGKPSVEGLSCPFEDLDGLTANNVKAIIWAYNENIVKGTSATTFGPRANCTRGQLVIMLYRYNRLMGLVPPEGRPSGGSMLNAKRIMQDGERAGLPDTFC